METKVTRLVFLLKTNGWTVNRLVNRLIIYDEVFGLESYIITFEPRFDVIVNSFITDSLGKLRLLVNSVRYQLDTNYYYYNTTGHVVEYVAHPRTSSRPKQVSKGIIS